jgi:hypothetical protein
MFKKNYAAIMFLVAGMFAGTNALASDVFMEQSGDDVLINITQTNGMNIVNTQNNPSIVDGDGIRIDMLQDGDGNSADIYLGNNSDGTILDYTAIGSFNELTVDLSNAIDNSMTIGVEGDNNRVSVCGNLACTTSASVNDTINVINVDGSSNNIRFALNANNSRNTVNVTGDTNSVDLTQSSGASHIANVSIIGGNNTVSITQGQ